MSMDGGLYASDDVAPEVLGDQSAPVIEQVEIAAKYAGYIDRQQQEIDRHRTQEETRLPPDFPFDQVRGLSSEVREKLLRVRPVSYTHLDVYKRQAEELVVHN